MLRRDPFHCEKEILASRFRLNNQMSVLSMAGRFVALYIGIRAGSQVFGITLAPEI